jgi:hypothetical protein
LASGDWGVACVKNAAKNRGRLQNMIEVAPSELKLAVERTHGGTATYVQSVPVTETHGGQAVWQGAVAVFDLAEHPKDKRAYAWSSPIEGSENRRFHAVLQMGAIKLPADAVRAAIVAEAKAQS